MSKININRPGLIAAAAWHRQQRAAFDAQMKADEGEYNQAVAEDAPGEQVQALLYKWGASSSMASNHLDYAAEFERMAEGEGQTAAELKPTLDPLHDVLLGALTAAESIQVQPDHPLHDRILAMRKLAERLLGDAYLNVTTLALQSTNMIAEFDGAVQKTAEAQPHAGPVSSSPAPAASMTPLMLELLRESAKLGKDIWNKGLDGSDQQYPNTLNCTELALKMDHALLQLPARALLFQTQLALARLMKQSVQLWRAIGEHGLMSGGEQYPNSLCCIDLSQNITHALEAYEKGAGQ